MLTKDVTQEIEAAIEQIHALGKEPTVALVKSRISTGVPMPALITAIRSWKNAKRVPKVEVAAQQEPSDRLTELENKVATLTARIEQLEALLGEKA
ncbi:hypothetical protein ACPV5L_13025 [Vibrio astriarenae]|jgi:uncharacterized protein YlxW (UPF0749 family)